MKKIDYQNLLDNALKSVVKDALVHAQFNGLGNETHFFITFRTRDSGVVLPDFLKIKYPDIMTIVLQHSYNNLNISEKEFGVQLTFDGRPFFIRVPFESIIEFKDPSVDFMLSFQPKDKQTAGNDLELPLVEKAEDSSARIVNLDAFRKNRKPELKLEISDKPI